LRLKPDVNTEGAPGALLRATAPRPVNAEGTRHLLYELHITNFGRADLTLERIEVWSAGGDTVLATYSGDSLTGVLWRPGMAVLADKRIRDLGCAP